MKVLISIASKHGSTDDIGNEIAARLRGADIEVDVVPAAKNPRIDEYDACIIGSALGQLLFAVGRWDDAQAEVEVLPDEFKDPSATCCDRGVAAVPLEPGRMRDQGHAVVPAQVLRLGEVAAVARLHSERGEKGSCNQ